MTRILLILLLAIPAVAQDTEEWKWEIIHILETGYDLNDDLRDDYWFTTSSDNHARYTQRNGRNWLRAECDPCIRNSYAFSRVIDLPSHTHDGEAVDFDDIEVGFSFAREPGQVSDIYLNGRLLLRVNYNPAPFIFVGQGQKGWKAGSNVLSVVVSQLSDTPRFVGFAWYESQIRFHARPNRTLRDSRAKGRRKG